MSAFDVFLERELVAMGVYVYRRARTEGVFVLPNGTRLYLRTIEECEQVLLILNSSQGTTTAPT